VSPLEGPPLCIIQQGKQKSRDLAEAVIAGYRALGGLGGEVHYGEIAEVAIHDDYTPVVIGVHPTTVDTLHDLRRARRPYVTVDNGYFKPYREGGYFRATSNALQWIARGQPSASRGRRPVAAEVGKTRWDALGIELQPWQLDRKGKPILIALQSPVWLSMMGECPTWLDSVTQEIRAHCANEIIVRHKPLKDAPPQPPLDEQLREVAAVVAYSSNVLLRAAIAGVPVFPTATCAASPLGRATPWLVNDPAGPAREPVFHDLAANQWTLDEIAAGTMWRDLNDRYEPEFYSLA
jgi:hypothetical protein